MLPLRFVQFLVRRCTRRNLWCSHRPPLHTESRQVWSPTHFVWIIFLFKNIDLAGGQINDDWPPRRFVITGTRRGPIMLYLQKAGFSAVGFQTAFYRLSAISRKSANFHGKKFKYVKNYMI